MSHYSQGPPLLRLCSLPEAQRLPYRKGVECQGVQCLLLGVKFCHFKDAPQHIPRDLVPHSDIHSDWPVLFSVMDRYPQHIHGYLKTRPRCSRMSRGVSRRSACESRSGYRHSHFSPLCIKTSVIPGNILDNKVQSRYLYLKPIPIPIISFDFW